MPKKKSESPKKRGSGKRSETPEKDAVTTPAPTATTSKKDAKKAKGAAEKDAKKASKKAKVSSKNKGSSKKAAADTTVDEVELLKRALRDTEAALVDAEHRLRLAQQELAGERRAAAEAGLEEAEDEIVEAAAIETVAEVLLEAEQEAADIVDAPLAGAAVAQAVAETLEAVADAEPPADAPAESAEEAAAVLAGAPVLTEPAIEPVPVEDLAPVTPSPAVSPFTPPLPSGTRRTEARAVPDESWTVAHLREEARARGIAGITGKSKAQLLDALRG